MSQSPAEFSPIAIIGMGCRFPGAPSVDAYWQLLLDGTDAIREVPAERWDVEEFHDPRPATPCKTISRCGGFVEAIDTFDPYFFGISPREANRLDPQQRLLLECTWHAMEHAGLRRERFEGTRTGVFMGVCTDDYITMQRGDLRNIDIYMGTGGSRGSTAGRLAFAYGLRGPVAAIDTACSSSLVAVHQACNSLQVGDCDMALAGGVNVVLSPGAAIAFSQASMLSPDGRCKAFDARANGFVRSEGAGVVLLKPLARALEDGNPIYAVIRGTATNNDGSTSPFMTPSRIGQAELLRTAYDRAGIPASSVQYVEAHGTGTEVGDPVEVGALTDVFAPGREDAATCLLGSSKTNIGHLEAAAGVAGLIKATLVLHHRLVPPNLHYETPNPNIPWDSIPFRVPTAVTPLPDDGKPARAGVNSFGISGTNAHIVLEAASTRPPISPDAANDRPELFLLSSHTEETLRSMADAWHRLASSNNASSLRDLCFTSGARLTDHEHRLAIVSTSTRELTARLDAWRRGELPDGVFTGTAVLEHDHRPVFVFSGIGTQWPRMGMSLLESDAVFGDAMRACDAAIHRIAGWSVVDELRKPDAESRIDRIDLMQPAIFSIQVALAARWQHWGITPAAIVGHSLGEIAAAHVAGALSLHDAARVVVERSRLMHRVSGQGRMAAVGLPAAVVRARLTASGAAATVAVVNAPDACTISGDTDAIEELVQVFTGEGVFCRLLKVDVACHSHHMQPLAGELVSHLATVSPRAATVPLFSSLLGTRLSGDEMDAAYWGENLRCPVEFETATQLLLSEGHRVFLELSPAPALVRPLRQNALHRDLSIVAAGSLRAGDDERTALLHGAAELAVNGTRIDWNRLCPDGRFIPPPAYVWSRDRYWFAEKGAYSQHFFNAGQGTGKHATGHPLLGVHWELADDAGTHCFEAELDLRSTPWLGDHKAEGMPLFPAAGYIELAVAASMFLHGAAPRVVRDVRLHKALFLQQDQPTSLQLIVSDGLRHSRRVETHMGTDGPVSLMFRCYARLQHTDDAGGAKPEWTLLADGHVELPTPSDVPPPAQAPVATREELNSAQAIPGEEFYATIGTGLHFGPMFQSVAHAWTIEGKRAITRIQLPHATVSDARSYRLHPALLDGVFHSLYATSRDAATLSIPYALDRIELFAIPQASESLWCEVAIIRTDVGHRSTLEVTDETGAIQFRVDGYCSKLLETPASDSDASADWLYEQQWRAVPPASGVPAAGRLWILVSAKDANVVGRDPLDAGLREALLASGQRVATVNAAGDTDAMLSRLAEFGAVDSLAGIVFLDATSAGAAMQEHGIPERAAHTTQLLLSLLQACGHVPWATVPRVFVVTRDARTMGSGAATPLDLSHAPLIGLARVAAIEMRELRVTQVDVDDTVPARVLATELLNADAEQEVALRADARYVPRLSRLDSSASVARRQVTVAPDSPHSWRLESTGSGVFEDLGLHQQPRRAPGAGEIEVQVLAVGLNFLDVLKALNMAPGLPADARFFGMECGARVVAVGPDVRGFEVGDEVIVLDTTASGCFRAFMTVRATAAYPKPRGVALVDAVTMPIAYQTAWYALCELGRLRAGESILIHSAAGGVGLAALHIAKQCGAIVFATAGTEEKREYLAAHGADFVMNSRTLDFAREVREFTNGRGIDMVLNSLAGEAIPASLSLLATGGRFLEIGKRDIYADSQIGLLPFQRNLSFFAVDLLRMRLEKPDVVEELTRQVVERMHDGRFAVLPKTTFSVRNVADAFRYMAKGSHIGKVVVTLDAPELEVGYVPAPVAIRADGTYLITGGLGALGLAFADYLVARGARQLVLLGRRAPSESADNAILALRERGATVDVVAANVADAEAVREVLQEVRTGRPPLRGVLHAAGVTDDRTLRQLTPKHFESVFEAKVHGAWNLHRALQDDAIDFLVFFSSAASVMGGAGQANYAAANAFLDALAHHRRQLDLPALSINWGPWADIGMAAADDMRGARLASRGIESIPVREGTELLDRLLQQQAAQVAVMPVNWHTWAERMPEATQVPFLAELASEWSGSATSNTGRDVRQSIRDAASNTEAAERLTEYLTADIARILRVPLDRLNAQVSLIRFGMDSLMAVELKNRIESEFDVNMPAARLLQGPSVTELAEWLAGAMRSGSTGTRAASTTESVSPPPPTPVDVDTLTDSEVEALLETMLTDDNRADVA